jgi:hypothetical protein
LRIYQETSQSLIVEAARGLDNAADDHPQHYGLIEFINWDVIITDLSQFLPRGDLFSHYLRLILVLSCLPLLAFTCTYVKQISIAVPSKPEQGLKEVSVEKENYDAVLVVLEHWAEKYGLEKVDCRRYPVKTERFPDLCTAYGFDYKTRALVGPNIERIVISIFYDRQIGKTIVQLFEQEPFQSSKSKGIEKELGDLLSQRFGKDAIQIIPR